MGRDVLPGEIYRFGGSAQAPQDPGVYTLEIGLVRQDDATGISEFAAPLLRWPIAVVGIPQARRILEELFGGQPLTLIGQVRSDQTVKISRHGQALVESPLETLKAAWERRFGSLV